MPRPEIFNLPPKEAVEHFRAKGLHVGYSWLDTSAEEHVRSFTVAKAGKLDILQDFERAVGRTIDEGITFEEFYDELEPTLRAKGWWGRHRMVDPLTGEIRTVQLGSPHRLKTIFDTNLRMAYAKGRWEMIERTAHRAPWLLYDAVNDGKTRPDHLAWDGTLLRWDDPWWQTHYPPNGWRCRCRVIQLSDARLEEFGLTPSEGPPPGSMQSRPWTNKRTGVTIQVPVGIDPGFGHNVGLVGRARDTGDRLIEKMDAAWPELARAAVGQPWRGALFRRHLAGQVEGDWPVAVTPAAAAASLNAQSHTVRLSSATATKQASRHDDVGARDYALVQRILDEGELFAGRDGRVIGFLESGGQLWRVVLKVTADRSEAYLVSFHKAQAHNLDAARRQLKRIGR